MADWRQIQARIRKAKAASDAPTQLVELYERTRDAMVAFELATWHEKAGDSAEAVRWYTAAAEKFRRAQWRTKSEEALTRLGAPIPVYTAETGEPSKARESTASDEPSAPKKTASVSADLPEQAEPVVKRAAEQAAEDDDEESPAGSAEEPDGAAEAAPASATGEPLGKKRRRRGRRGGRKRRSASAQTSTAGPVSNTRESSAKPSGAAGVSTPLPFIAPPRATPDAGSLPAARSASGRAAPPQEAEVAETTASRERGSESAGAGGPSWQGRTRAGEPAIASRISQLESQLRRLLACPLGSLDDADQAPAGPGVLLLSDSDQVTHYYIESCQTLRIGIGNLLRGGRGSKDGALLKERMAENLGIAELRVSRYLKDHCAVRWLQLDEGAPDLAHFAIAVLRPVVNE